MKRRGLPIAQLIKRAPLTFRPRSFVDALVAGIRQSFTGQLRHRHRIVRDLR